MDTEFARNSISSREAEQAPFEMKAKEGEEEIP